MGCDKRVIGAIVNFLPLFFEISSDRGDDISITEAEDMPVTVSLVFSMTGRDSLSTGNMASNIYLWPHKVDD